MFHPAVASHGVNGFVLRPLTFPPEFGIVHLRHPTATDGATEAGLRLHEQVPREGLAVDRFPVVESPLLEVARWQHPEVLGAHDGDGRSVEVERVFASFESFLEPLVEPLYDVGKALGIVQRDVARPANRHRLEVLRTHHGADPRAAGGPIAVVHDGGEEHLPLTGGTDTGHAGLPVRFLPECIVRLVGAHSPQMPGRPQFGLSVGNPKIDRFRRSTREDDRIHPGLLQFRRIVPARVGAGNRPRERRFGGDHIPRTRRRLGARQGTHGHDQCVLRPECIAIRVRFVQQVSDSESSPADVIPGHGGIERFFAHRPPGQVHPQDFSHPPVHWSSSLYALNPAVPRGQCHQNDASKPRSHRSVMQGGHGFIVPTGSGFGRPPGTAGNASLLPTLQLATGTLCRSGFQPRSHRSVPL